MDRIAFSELARTEDSFLMRKVRKEVRAVGPSQSTASRTSPSMAFSYILLGLLGVTSTYCSEPHASRIDLFRFFMGFGPEVSPVQKVSFNPEAGLRFREQFQKKYGPRGQLLIERFGQGLAMQGPSVVDVDQLLDVPNKNKTKHYRTLDFNPPKPRGKNKNGVKIDIQLSTTTSPEESTS